MIAAYTSIQIDSALSSRMVVVRGPIRQPLGLVFPDDGRTEIHVNSAGVQHRTYGISGGFTVLGPDGIWVCFWQCRRFYC